MGMLPASFGRHIKHLEESVGTRLLSRTTRYVALTPAGQDFVEAARDIVARADRLEARFRDAKHQEARVLRIGAIDSAALGLMPQLLPHFREANPEIDVELLEQKTIRLLPPVLSGRLDVAFVRTPEHRDARLSFKHLFQETAVVAVPAQHHLAARAIISVSDMAEEPLIVPDRSSRPHSHDLTIKLFLEAGHSARIAQIAEEKQTIVSLVGTGVGLAIVPRWTSRLAVSGVRFIALNQGSAAQHRALDLSAVWLSNTRHPARDAFLKVLSEHLDELVESA
jgi:DNA-binding transcriptional LysR family regulator